MQNIDAGLYFESATAFENPHTTFGLIPLPNSSGERRFRREDTNLIARINDHADLHEWMQEHYREAGGEGDFNCETLVIDASAINALITTFPELSDVWRHAHRRIQDGLIVYYESWF